LIAEEERARQQTSLAFRRAGDGTTKLYGRLPDAHADMLKAVLDGYASPRRNTDRSDADRLDDGSARLTYQQRLGRALIELIEHLPVDTLPRHGATSTTVVVTITLDQLLGGLGQTILDTGTLMSAGQARRLACNAGIIPAVLDGDSRILDLGTSRRLYDRHQRIALAVRDGGCIFPGCSRPPSFCEAHHIVEWSRGGPTDLDHGCLLCSFHHHLIHHGEWAVVMAADGVPEIIPPARIDPERKPRRHSRLRTRRC
jgi:hypothetical protein